MSTMTIDALNAAAASMASDVSRLSVISQNLTNATTPGYKRSVAAFVTQDEYERDVRIGGVQNQEGQ